VGVQLKLAEAPLPRTLEQVTPTWLSEALAVNYPGAAVTGFSLSGEIDGTASKVRLALDYNEAGRDYGLPPSAWLKGGFEGRAFGNAPTFVAEARFFTDWAPLLPINIPRAFYSGVDPTGEQGLVLIEDLDLRGATYGKSTAPLTPERAARVLDVRAHCHAALWESPRIAGLRTYRDRFAGTNHWVAQMTAPGVYERWIETPRFAHVAKALHDPHAYAAGMDALYGFTEQGPLCFNQGDAHLGNIFFEADGTPGILDWQAYIRCNGMVDVAYFLIGAIGIEDRRQHERDLIAGYLDSLKRHGVKAPPSFDQAWLDYRRFALHGFAWTMTTGEFHPEDVIQAYADRYGAAAGDLESLKALGV
jgi:hypothetical protein